MVASLADVAQSHRQGETQTEKKNGAGGEGGRDESRERQRKGKRRRARSEPGEYGMKMKKGWKTRRIKQRRAEAVDARVVAVGRKRTSRKKQREKNRAAG